MKVLLVEDEEHKANDLTARLYKLGIAKHDLTTVSGVRHAVLHVTEGHFSLIIVDMALPTFSDISSEGSGGGDAQAVGGIEVLRALFAAGVSSTIIIVTQYPDIIVSGTRVRLTSAARVLSKKYKQNVLGAVLYSYKSPDWETAFDTLVRKAQ
ncbi:response regulator receiver domain protein [Rhodopseudomonas palustris HaA2]|uniref:Response regulator receiver domain protein n=1 Tax=Rhodopseudomonas palustris (strain HaA2) TaxID=316058 RepID=Q2IUU7_RHOP2|nr:transcriptional regulator [Rhodopseudomonas palustris]ABD08013.1 response regulator receiver domain protein [Rhodopseudomonas palustris HaA2]